MKQNELTKSKRISCLLNNDDIGDLEKLINDREIAFQYLRENVNLISVNPDQNRLIFERIIYILNRIEEMDKDGCGITPEMFFYIASLRYFKEIHLQILAFLNNVIKENPQIANRFLSDSSIQFQDFLRIYESPFYGWEYEILKNLLLSSQDVCNKIIAMGLMDYIQTCFTRIFSNNNIRYSEDIIVNYFIAAFDIFIIVVRNSMHSILLLDRINDLCLMAIKKEFLNDVFCGVFSKAVDCLSEIIIIIPNEIKDLLLDYIQLFQMAFRCKEHRVLCSMLKLIGLMVKPPKPFDFLKEYSQDILDNINLFEEREMCLLINLFCESILSFPKTIDIILKNNILHYAYNAFEYATIDFKCKSALLFSRLTNSYYWEYVSNFFAEKKIILELANILCLCITKDLSKQIIHGFKNIIFAIKTSGDIEGNKENLNQLYEMTSEQYYNEITFSRNDDVINDFSEMITMLKEIV